MKIFQFINHAEKSLGGAQKIAHHIHDAFRESEIFGYDCSYKNETKKTSSLFIFIFHYLFCAIFRRKNVIFLHHRIFLILNFFFRHKNSYFICHNIFPNKNFIFKINTSVKYVAVSDEVFDYLGIHCPSASISKIYNGLDIDKASYKSEYSDQFKIYYIGRLTDQKGVGYLIEMFKRFSEKKTNIYLKIIGDGEKRSELLLRAHGYSNIEFLGKRDYPFRYCIDASVLVIPSLYEGFGLVYYEALEYGHNVLASDLAVFEKFSEDDCVRFFENGSVGSMQQQLECLYSTIVSGVKPIKKRHRFQSVEVMKKEYQRLVGEQDGKRKRPLI